MNIIHRISFYLLILMIGLFGGFIINEKYFSDPCPETESISIQNIKGKRGSTVTIDVSKIEENTTPEVKERKGILKLFKRKKYE